MSYSDIANRNRPKAQSPYVRRVIDAIRADWLRRFTDRTVKRDKGPRLIVHYRPSARMRYTDQADEHRPKGAY